MFLTDVAIKNRTTVAVLGLIIILVGGYSYVSLPREAAPDIPIPYILVTTTYNGVSPEDIETSVDEDRKGAQRYSGRQRDHVQQRRGNVAD